jgi:hypothetical protein
MIKCIKEFDLGEENIKIFSMVPVNIGNGKRAFLCVFSKDDVDPGEEFFHFPKDTLKFSLFDEYGKKLWTKDLGEGVIPGVWYCPVLPFDLDKDGIDEIYYLNNLNPSAPLTMEARVLEALSPITGQTIGQWKWPMTTFNERLSLAYRYYLIAGYSHGEPVLITAQGTYEDMYLQGYGTGMNKKWEIVFPKEAGGPKASHLTPVIDINDDGIDELFWGERLISIETGETIKCFDKSFNGHSDKIIPFIDYETGKKYLYTTREGYDEIPPRVVTFDVDTGNIVWKALEKGHIHFGWIGTVGVEQTPKRIAMATRVNQRFTQTGQVVDGKEVFYFDAFSGQEIELDVPFKGYDAMPLDINGDGISEFFCRSGEYAGCFFDQQGKMFFRIEEILTARGARILPEIPCEQLLVLLKSGKVKIFADTTAKESKLFEFKHSYKGYHNFCERLMASGYNKLGSDSLCGI